MGTELAHLEKHFNIEGGKMMELLLIILKTLVQNGLWCSEGGITAHSTITSDGLPYISDNTKLTKLASNQANYRELSQEREGDVSILKRAMPPTCWKPTDPCLLPPKNSAENDKQWSLCSGFANSH
jgi:hypothetical protein